jgi:Ca-activated chloride channel family protein
MGKLFKKITQKHRPNSQAVVKIDQNSELFPFLLWIALLFLLLSFSSLPKLHLLLLPLMLQPVGSRAGLLDFMTLQKAQTAYENKEYEKAAKHYRRVLGSPQSYFNLANSYYKAGRYEEAIRNYKRVETKDSDLKAKAEYNLANAYVKTKQYDKALERYKRSLGLRRDEDARYNYEKLKKMLERSEQQSKTGGKKTPEGAKKPSSQPQKQSGQQQKPAGEKSGAQQPGEKKSSPQVTAPTAKKKTEGASRSGMYEKYKKQLPAPPTQLFVIQNPEKRGSDDTSNPW